MVRFSRGRLVVLRMCYPQGIVSVPYRHNMVVTPGDCKSLVKDQGPPPLNWVECAHFWASVSARSCASSCARCRLSAPIPPSLRERCGQVRSPQHTLGAFAFLGFGISEVFTTKPKLMYNSVHIVTSTVRCDCLRSPRCVAGGFRILGFAIAKVWTAKPRLTYNIGHIFFPPYGRDVTKCGAPSTHWGLSHFLAFYLRQFHAAIRD